MRHNRALTLAIISLSLLAPTRAFGDTLEQKRSALAWELRHAEGDKDAYYLLVSPSDGVLHLKAGGRILLDIDIQSFRGLSGRGVTPLKLQGILHPHSRELGPTRGRLGGRALPLDFIGRLTEGAREASRLYFSPSFLLAGDADVPRHLPSVVVTPVNLKTLAAAVDTHTPILLIGSPAP